MPGWAGSTVMATSFPLPLAWEGTTDYPNAVYAPQSEAGLWNAIALNSVLGNGRATHALSQAVNDASSESVLKVLEEDSSARSFDPDWASDFPWKAACGGDLEGELSSASCAVLMARQRIHDVQQFYLSSKTWYEANLTAVLDLQVASSAALSAGNLTLALSLAKQAGDLEWAAVDVLLPSSTSVYFIPGTASYGILALRVAEMANTMKEKSGSDDAGLNSDAIDALLKQAKKAFERCLAPEGRPNLSLCLLGAARVERLIESQGMEKGQEEEEESRTKEFYKRLMQNWVEGGDGGKAAEEGCADAWEEATEFLTS